MKPAITLFCLISLVALAGYPAREPQVLLRNQEIPSELPGMWRLEATLPGDAKRAGAELVCALRVFRYIRTGTTLELLPQEEGDARTLRLESGRAVAIPIRIPRLPRGEEMTVAALVVVGDDEEYLKDIATVRTVSPQGIAPFASMSLGVSARAGRAEVRLK